MEETRVLLVFPGSLYGGHWADGPRVKPELVGLSSELRRAGYAVDVLDLEVELGQPGDDAERAAFLDAAGAALAARPADLVVVSCWSALQYSAAVAVAERTRVAHPNAVIAVEGHQVSVRPDDFNDPGAPFDWLVVGEAESAVLTIARAVATGERETGTCHSLEGTPTGPRPRSTCPTTAPTRTLPRGCRSSSVFLSRGCPYNAPACLLRPGGGGWHAFPPHVAVAILTGLAELRPSRLDVLDPAFGYDPVWRHAVLEGLAASDRRDLAAHRGRQACRSHAARHRRALPGARAPAPRRRHAVARAAVADRPGATAGRRRRARPRPAGLRQRQGPPHGGLVHLQPAGRDGGVGRRDAGRARGLRRRGAQRVRLGAGRSPGPSSRPASRRPTSTRRRAASARASSTRSGGRDVPARGRREGGRGQRRARASAARRRELLAAALRGAARGPGREAHLRGAARAAQPRDGRVRGLRRARTAGGSSRAGTDAARPRHATRARLPRPAPRTGSSRGTPFVCRRAPAGL